MAILKMNITKVKDITELSKLELLRLVNSVVDRFKSIKEEQTHHQIALSDLIDEFPILRNSLNQRSKDHPGLSDIQLIYVLLREAEKQGVKDVTATVCTDKHGYQHLKFSYTNIWMKYTLHWVPSWVGEYYFIIQESKMLINIFINDEGMIRIIRKDK